MRYTTDSETGLNPRGLFLIMGGAIVIASLLIAWLSFYSINEGERGVLLRNGRIVKVAQPGLGLKWPIIESVEKITVRYERLQLRSATRKNDRIRELPCSADRSGTRLQWLSDG